MKKRRFVIIVTLIAILFLIYVQYNHAETADVELGVLDITRWDFNNEKAVEIKDDWEIYDESVYPDEIENHLVDNFGNINDYNAKNEVLDEIVTTYHLSIINNNSDIYGLIIEDFYNDYRLYINGVMMIDETYCDGETFCSNKLKNDVVYFNSEGDIDIVLQVYRNNEQKDVKWSSVYFGTNDRISHIHEANLGYDYILIGNSIIMSLLFGCVFFISKDYYKYTFGYLSLFGFNLAFGALVSGEKIITNIFSFVDYSFIFKSQQLFFHLAIILLIYLVDSYFRINKRSTMDLYFRYIIAMVVLIVFLPIDLYMTIMPIFQILTFILGLYVLHILYHAFNFHYSDVVELLLGYMIIVVFTINDVLHSMQYIDSGFIAISGLAVFIYINAMIIFTKYLTQSVKAEHLNQEVIELNKTIDQKVNKRTRQLQEKVDKDSLTKIYNHEYLYKELRKVHNNSRYDNRTYSILMIDIDHFKKVNDVYGHQTGDEVLRKISLYLNKYRRHEDIVGRYGGEEFMMILPDTGIKNAYKVAEKHRVNISDLNFNNHDIKITVSIGVAEYENGKSPQEIISIVDQRMYKAKATGRNNTIMD